MLDIEKNEFDHSQSCSNKTKLSKRYCFKTPEGKYVYAWARSETDSYMAANSERDTKAYNNEDYLNLEYLNENIDFPPEIDADPIELYSVNRPIYCVLLLIATFINSACSIYSLSTTRSVLSTIFAINKIYNIPVQLILFINWVLLLDIFLFLMVFMTGVFSLRNDWSLDNIISI